ncbi:MAG: M1 family metallopeptidase [Bacteroidetes bacterium]|nr:M1 family metallopeptidase [Bacteroidota bacterium]
MKTVQILLFILLASFTLSAQDEEPKNDSWKSVYQATATKINDLVHTKIDVKFDYDKSYLYGKAWITLKPHFYSTDSLSLDAKGMDIHKVDLIKGNSKSPLKYDYDGLVLKIHLDKQYKNNENYTVFIDYTSKPNELKHGGSKAITDDKGLYFINPHGEEKDKPIQVWTQGETQSTSVWCPTIDQPNQKCTQEFIMTVPAKYVSLSNGKLISQKNNTDGTRTDTWKMDLPNAPYLFFMGIGDYAVIKDFYKGKEVNYYVEKEYASVARKIFGLTPEMMGFYSRILGVEFPWVKYSQMTARDYVSGAMENTTATLHSDILQQDARQLTDGNAYEEYVAHELFHQWFGDLVTTESWSNLTVNESFADFSETLWNEYKHGKDAGDAANFKGIEKYLRDESNPSKNLVRFHYADREDMFDMVSYSKGGRILNMLRNYVGDSAFFKSLNLYLTTNKFKSAEAQQLRLAFEEITGQDLNWYWNQWYYGAGHPILNINYVYDDAAKKVNVIIHQSQGDSSETANKAFRLPLAIDVYNGANKVRHKVWVNNATDTFTFSYTTKPDLVNVDGDKILLCEKTDNKTLDNFIHQYKYAGLYLDRKEAIDFCAAKQDDPKAIDLLKVAVKDRYHELRQYALSALDLEKKNVKEIFEPIIFDLAKNDPYKLVRAEAIELLGTYKNAAYKDFFIQAVSDSSYSVAGNALEALSNIDENESYSLALKVSKQPMKGDLLSAVIDAFIKAGDQSQFDLIATEYDKMPLSQKKMDNLPYFAAMLLKIQNTEQVKKGIDAIVKVRNTVPKSQREEFAVLINDNILKPIAERKKAAGLKDQSDYITSKLTDAKKGF